MIKKDFIKTIKTIIPAMLSCVLLISCSDKLPDFNDPVVIVDPPLYLQLTQISENGKLLTWFDNSSSEDGYILERSLNNPAEYTRLAKLPANAVSFLDSTVVEDTNTVIYYRLYAFKGNSTSKSVTLSFKKNGLIAPSGFMFEQLPDKSIKLSWRDNSAIETGFTVERSDGSSGFKQIANLPPNTTTFLDSGLDTNKIYSYRIAARMNKTTAYCPNQAVMQYNLSIESVQPVENTYGVQDAQFVPNTDYIMLNSSFYSWLAGGPIKIIKRDGTFVRELPDKNNVVVVSPSGKIIATCGFNTDINIWDIETGTLKQVIKRRDKSMLVDNIAVSPKDDLIAVYQHISTGNSDGNIDVFNLSDGSFRWTRTIIYSRSILQFSQDGSSLLYTNFDMNTSYIRLDRVDATDGLYLNSVTSYQFARWSTFSPSGRYMLMAVDNSMSNCDYYLIDLEGGRPQEKISYVSSAENIGSATIAEPNGGSAPYINFSSYSGQEYISIGTNETNIKWRITVRPYTTPVFISAFQNIKLYPGGIYAGNYALGYGTNTKVKILKIGKKWVSYPL